MAKSLIEKVLDYFKSFEGDQIIFKNDYCGNYTDYYSEIVSIGLGIKDFKVKVNPAYNNPDCVDTNNITTVTIDSIVTILPVPTKFELYKIDEKILELKSYIENFQYNLFQNNLFQKGDKEKLDELLIRFNSFFDEIKLEDSLSPQNNIEKLIDRSRFSSLFIGL